MFNTSYAVKPELFKDNQIEVKISYIEKIEKVHRETNGIRLETNINDFYLEIYEKMIVRFITYNQKFDLDKSFSLEKLDPIGDFQMDSNDLETIISYLDLRIKIKHHPFSFTIYRNKILRFQFKAIGFDNTTSYLFLDRHRDDLIYGLGEKTGFLSKNNEKTVNWNKDVFEPHTRTNKELYQSINMFSYMSETNKFGMFIDNPGKMIFDFDTFEDTGVIITDISKLDCYLYTGNKLKDIVHEHSVITGKSYLPPLWALGYHQSRHSYESVEVLKSIYEKFKQKQIPLDAIYLDILYMDRYKVFTFNPETFKGIKEVIHELKANGVKVVPIVDPGVKVEEGYSIYEEGITKDLFCKFADGKIFKGDVWPGESVFYDFMNTRIRNKWGEQHQFYTDLGIEGIWNDMNEPSVFNGPNNTMSLEVSHDIDGKESSHRESHNLYGLGMSMATSLGIKKILNKRPFVLTRAGYAGIQKFAHVWTGDNRSSWEHMEMTLPMCLNLGMSGVSLCGPDIGGFMDDTNEEMLIRWTQMGVFLPFFRNHSSIGTKRQEPWQFGERAETIILKFINLRYELIRFIYSEVFKSHQLGLPIMRPLVLEFENDPNTHHIHDEYLLGSNLLVAPIIRPGEKYRKVYLPDGDWYDFFTNKKYTGSQYIIVKAELNEIPIFVRAGSIIPLTTSAMNTEELTNKIVINIYESNNNFTDYFVIDDGISLNEVYSEIWVSYNNNEVKFETKGNYRHNLEFDFKIIK